MAYSDNDSDYTDSDHSFGEREKNKINRRKRCEVGNTTIVPDVLLEPYTTFSAEKSKNKPLVTYSDSDSGYTDSDHSLGEPEKNKAKRRKRCEVDNFNWTDRCNAKKREKGQQYFGRKKKMANGTTK